MARNAGESEGNHGQAPPCGKLRGILASSARRFDIPARVSPGSAAADPPMVLTRPRRNLESGVVEEVV
jgi:hypothetical protein